VLGSDLARKLHKGVGDTLDIRGTTFTVVGVLEPTLTAPDATVRVPLAAAQAIYVGDLPPVVRQSLRADRIATDITVYPDDGADVEALAARIIKLLFSPGLADLLGSAARRTVCERFSLESMVTGTLAAYQAARRVAAGVIG